MYLNLKFIRKIFLILSVVLFAGLVGFQLGKQSIVVPKERADFQLFWNVWDEVSKKYVDKTKLDTKKMILGAISGMVASIDDPYTVFLPPAQNKEVKDDLNGSFEGIGAQLGMKDKKIIVIAPLSGSPAQIAGIKAGDWILKVDGQDTSSWSLPETVVKIKGQKGTKVTLDIYRSGWSMSRDVTITRDTIILDSVTWKNDGSIALVTLSRFGDQTFTQWDKVVGEVASASVSGIILDLRNNPGGYLNGAVYVASEFMLSGVVVKQVDYMDKTLTYSVDRRGKLLTQPLVVLVNGGTASAGEILAGSLKVAGRAKIVGEKTFGKGSVQETQDFANGAGLHVTTAKWLLANGVWINGKGLDPDIKISNDEKDPTMDLQMQRAIKELAK